jgi:hypothetical protein
MKQFFNIFWGVSQLLPFFLGMRLLLVTRLSNNYGLTKSLSTFNKVWWGIAASYISVIVLCCFINMCMNPGGGELYYWWPSSGARIAFSKIFLIMVSLINIAGTVLVCIGIHWFNIHRRTRMIAKGGCLSGLLIYYIIWQSIISIFVLLTPFMLNSAVNWLPPTIAGMTFMNLPFVSAMSGSDSFSQILGKTASFYFEPESDLALLQSEAQDVFTVQQVVYQQPQQVVY